MILLPFHAVLSNVHKISIFSKGKTWPVSCAIPNRYLHYLESSLVYKGFTDVTGLCVSLVLKGNHTLCHSSIFGNGEVCAVNTLHVCFALHCRAISITWCHMISLCPAAMIKSGLLDQQARKRDCRVPSLRASFHCAINLPGTCCR